jgi:hypothetical protein
MTAADRLPWRTSSRSSNGENCVEVAPHGAGVVIRHSKHRDDGTIEFTVSSWLAFMDETSRELPSCNGVAIATRLGTDTIVRSADDDVELRFDHGEWSAFVAGVVEGEFDFSEEFSSVTA